MTQNMLLKPIKFLVSIQLGQSKVRKYIPVPVFRRLKVLKYKLWLINTQLARNPKTNLLKLLRSKRSESKRILFYPDVPWETSVMAQICLQLGYEITNNISGDYDLAFKWKDATVYQPDQKLLELAEMREVINVRCNDIRKANVDAVHKEIFGYCTVVDPRTHQGICVRKSDFNAKHDGQIIECPVTEIEDGVIYQCLIDSRVDENHVMDIRIPIYRDMIPFVVTWVKPIHERFNVDVGERQYWETSEIFTNAEQVSILRFCRKIGLDYGELDILRNTPDGKIYIIDVNNTPDGGEIQAETERDDIRRESVIFINTFFNPERAEENYAGEKIPLHAFLENIH